MHVEQPVGRLPRAALDAGPALAAQGGQGAGVGTSIGNVAAVERAVRETLRQAPKTSGMHRRRTPGQTSGGRHEYRADWFLSAEALAVFKLLFARPKDYVDLERLVAVQIGTARRGVCAPLDRRHAGQRRRACRSLGRDRRPLPRALKREFHDTGAPTADELETIASISSAHDVIVAGATVVLSILRHYGKESVLVSDRGRRFGRLAELCD